MTSDWTPPPNGSPCWINIYAKDIRRARHFYSGVFDWNFRDESVHEGASRASEKIAKFHFPGTGLGGGITQIDEDDFITTQGKGGVTLFLYVDDLEEYVKKITTAGGRKLSEPVSESAQGVIQYFEDTEGNYFGLYNWQRPLSPRASDSGN